ncbi:MAG: WecB/TagA/CpsF family glycosyltransferase [Spirochaetota bacterium]|nr:MAG: WecB/TagA/CpsF family glycosyltransferase [Spirochaetota bacterium]
MGGLKSRKSINRDRVLGIPFDNISSKESLDVVEGYVRDDEPRTIVHLSVISLMRSRRDKNLRIFLEEADLIIPCGRYIYWAAKFLKRPLKEVIDPSQFIKLLMLQSVELEKRVYLFGGKDDTIDRAYENLKKDIPKLFVIGKYKGNYEKQNLEDVVTAIGKASPDYFFIGLGAPQEELWIERYGDKINAGIIIFIEGMFDLFAGKVGKHRRFKKEWEVGWLTKREIPHPRSFKKLWLVPIFMILVVLERLFWKH